MHEKFFRSWECDTPQNLFGLIVQLVTVRMKKIKNKVSTLQTKAKVHQEMCAIDRYLGASTIEAPVQKLCLIFVWDVSNSLLYSFVNSYFHIAENTSSTNNMENIIFLHLRLYDISVLSFIFPIRTHIQHQNWEW